MPDTASELARRLAQNAEAVCRHYLSNGHRQGRYWLVGDVANTPGRSLFVRLRGPDSGRGGAGKWTDAATGEHGDLLDLIAANRHLAWPDVLDEARRFLALPTHEHSAQAKADPALPGSPEAARRLFAMARPIAGTLAEAYLHERGIRFLGLTTALRFHPRCYYRAEGSEHPERDAWPALLAAVTDLGGTITGVQRTWLDPSGRSKAPVSSPRRAMGHLLGNAVRFGAVHDVMAAGEGIETMLSLRHVLPGMPTTAALSAGHLASFVLPATLRRLYIVQDNDPAGCWAARMLAGRALGDHIEALVLVPTLDDLNDDLRQLGTEALAAALRVQFAPEDVARFWPSVSPAGRRRTGRASVGALADRRGVKPPVREGRATAF